MKKTIKKALRACLKRMLGDTLVAKLKDNQPIIVNEIVLRDIDHYLHALRSHMISAMPSGAETVLSAGCAGKWYFEWIDQEYGKLKKHIGVEFYTPKPDALPGNVHWISSTVGDMSAVDEESVDMLISGQNIEHLWLDDMLGFLEEAWRVLKPGGWIIVDSPNAAVTSCMPYLHPQHVAEYKIDEIRELLGAAGFIIKHEKGVLQMRNSPSEPLWNFFDKLKWDGVDGMLRRAMGGIDKPDESFIWWIEAQKNGTRPDREKLIETVQRIFTSAYNERANRIAPDKCVIETDNNGIKWAVNDKAGLFWQGPSMPLARGIRNIKGEIHIYDSDNIHESSIAELAVIDDKGAIIVNKNIIANDFINYVYKFNEKFELDQTNFGVNLLITSTGSAKLKVPLTIEVA